MKNEIDKQKWVQLMNLNLSELISFLKELKLGSSIRFYCEIMISYLQGNFENLVSLKEGFQQTEFETAEFKKLIHIFYNMRYLVRSRSMLSLETIYGFEQEGMKIIPSDLFKGELNLLLAYGFQILREYKLASDYFQRAADNFISAQAFRKAIRCRLNTVTSSSCIEKKETKFLISEYNNIFLEAKKIGERMISALCLHNISREYQMIGTLQLALNLADRSLYYAKNEVGSLNHYVLLLHRCQLHLQLKNYVKARLDYEAASLAEFTEIKEGLKVINLSVNAENSKAIDKHILNPSWQERIEQLINHSSLKKEQSLTQLENQLIKSLKTPKTKNDLILEIYGSKVDFSYSEGKFYSLLFRLRKKIPHVIIYEGGCYRLRT